MYHLCNCHKPEIVLDSTSQSLNLPLWAVQLHISTRLRIWSTKTGRLKKWKIKKKEREKRNAFKLISIILNVLTKCVHVCLLHAVFVFTHCEAK